MTIVHTCHFSFKPQVAEEKVQEVSKFRIFQYPLCTEVSMDLTIPVLPSRAYHTSHTPHSQSFQCLSRLIDLKDQCIHHTTQNPYILSLECGINNSPEPFANNFKYAYVMVFASVEDREYYLQDDPASQAYYNDVAAAIERPQTLDFEPGVLR